MIHNCSQRLSSRPFAIFGIQRALHLICLFVLLLGLASPARAQDSPGRFEAGGSFTAISSFGPDGPFGPGIEGDVNFGRHIALDGTLNWLPQRFGLTVGGRVVQGLIGVKVGTRFQHFGIFVKARPGFITTGSALRSTTFDFAPTIPLVNIPDTFARLTEPALDLGGVFEYYPARHWALRYDLGDTLLFEEKVRVNVIGSIPPGFNLGAVDNGTTNHFQFSASVHYRF